MPASLHARGLSLALGPRQILIDVDVAVDPGQRIGLVGPNGVGKSTLLKVLAGLILPDAGSVQRAPGDATVGYLPQEPERGDELVSDFLARRTGVAAANTELDAATSDLAAGSTGADDRYSDALERWLALGAADFEARIGDTWDSLGLPPRLLTQSMVRLSGGEAARVGLAALLLARFDVFLLDEPTNDLDLDGLDRLERFVTSLGGGAVIVSHDRTFLARTVTHVVELDEFAHTAARYAGGWETYLREQELAREHARRAFEEYDAKRSSLASRSQREREWATQGLSKAKKNPSDGDKHIKSFKVNQSEQLAGKAARTDRAMERLEVVEEPREAWQLRMTIATAERSGDLVARLDGATVDRGDFHLGPITVEVNYGERVVIVGHNGSGKTSLLQALLGRLPLEGGTGRVGSGVVIGELEQARDQLDSHSTMLAGFLDETGMTVSEARTLLAKFGLRAGHVDRPTASLSPGERTRLVLALLMARGVNCLVLDEPTNHLDMPAIEQLEQALDTFPGTVLLISHDRTLLQSVRRTRTLTMDSGRLIGDTTT
jgi:ATPase subunit of ABC transporter with duplicated ATPase domains